MPPFDVTHADRQLALQQLANVLLPLVKQDKAKAQSWAMQIESKIYESTATKEVWQSKVYTKLKSIQQKAAQAHQARQPAAVPQPVPAPMAAPAMLPQAQQQQLVAQHQHPAVLMQQQQQMQAQQQQMQVQQQPMYQAVPQQMGMAPPPTAFAPQAQLMHQPPPQPQPQLQQPARQVEMTKMPTFNDPAFQQMAQAFLDAGDGTAAQQQQAHAAALQQQQQHTRMQAAAQQQAMQMRAQQLPVQQPVAAVQQMPGSYGQVGMMPQQAQQASGMPYQQVAPQQMMPQQHMAPQQMQPAHQLAAQQQIGMAPAQQAAQVAMLPVQPAQQLPMQQQPVQVKMETGMMQGAAGRPGMPVQHMQQPAMAPQMQVQQAPAPAVANTHLADYQKLQAFGKQQLVEEVKDMLRFFSASPDPNGNVRSRIMHFTTIVRMIEEKEPQLRAVIDAAAVQKLRDALVTLQKDVNKFRQYKERNKAKREQQALLQQQQAAAAQASNLAGSAATGGSNSLYTHQHQGFPGQAPMAPVTAFPGQQAVGLPLAAASPGASARAERMDESQPNLSSTVQGASPPNAAAGSMAAPLARAGSSTGPGLARNLPPPRPSPAAAAAAVAAAAAGVAASHAAGNIPRTSSGLAGLLAGGGGAGAAAAAEAAPAAAAAAGLAAAGPSVVTAVTAPRDGVPPLPVQDRLFVVLERRGDRDLSLAGAGVQRLVQHMQARLTMPPLPKDAAGLDGWPSEAVELLTQGPQVVLSRPGGSAWVGEQPQPLGAAQQQAQQAQQAPGGLSSEWGSPQPLAKRPRLEGGQQQQQQRGAAAAAGVEGGGDGGGDAAREQLWARLRGECSRMEAALSESHGAKLSLARVAEAEGTQPGSGLVLACEWQGSGAAAAAAAAAAAGAAPSEAPATPEGSAGGAAGASWRTLRLRVTPSYPAEPPVLLFPSGGSWGGGKDAGTGGGTEAALAELVKDELGALLPGLARPVTLEAVVGAWAQAVRGIAEQVSR